MKIRGFRFKQDSEFEKIIDHLKNHQGEDYKFSAVTDSGYVVNLAIAYNAVQKQIAIGVGFKDCYWPFAYTDTSAKTINHWTDMFLSLADKDGFDFVKDYIFEDFVRDFGKKYFEEDILPFREFMNTVFGSRI